MPVPKLTKAQREQILVALGMRQVTTHPDVYEVPALFDPSNPNYLAVVWAVAGLAGCDGPFPTQDEALAYLRKQHPEWTFASMCVMEGIVQYPWYYFKGC